MKDFQKWLMGELRRSHYKWTPRKEALKFSRESRGKYKCAHCHNLFGPKEIDVDHIEPVINPATSFVDWNDYINRLFCNRHGYQVLCKNCHYIKSALENSKR